MNNTKEYPFCGCTNLIILNNWPYYAIQCSACRAQGPEAFSHSAAINLWIRRVPDFDTKTAVAAPQCETTDGSDY